MPQEQLRRYIRWLSSEWSMAVYVYTKTGPKVQKLLKPVCNARSISIQIVTEFQLKKTATTSWTNELKTQRSYQSSPRTHQRALHHNQNQLRKEEEWKMQMWVSARTWWAGSSSPYLQTINAIHQVEQFEAIVCHSGIAAPWSLRSPGRHVIICSTVAVDHT